MLYFLILHYSLKIFVIFYYFTIKYISLVVKASNVMSYKVVLEGSATEAGWKFQKKKVERENVPWYWKDLSPR